MIVSAILFAKEMRIFADDDLGNIFLGIERAILKVNSEVWFTVRNIYSFVTKFRIETIISEYNLLCAFYIC